MANRIGSILKALCPACRKGKVREGIFGIRKRCPVCDYDLHPEPGFYMGAMAAGFMLTAALTIPPTVALKFMNVEIGLLVAFPLLEFILVGSFLMIYCKIIWLHLEYRLTKRLDGHSRK